MRHDKLTEQGQELAALYALGSLSQTEARAFEAHLAEGCEVCKAELEQFGLVAGVLAASAAPVEPPPYLRSVLEARINKEASLPSTKLPAAAQVIAFPEKPKPAVTDYPASRSKFGLTFLPWALAASLLLALTYSIAAWQSERKSLSASLAQNQSEAAQLREKLSRESSRADEIAQINSVLASPQNPRIEMAGLGEQASSSGKIYWDIQAKRWVVTADLPPAPSGKVYQLWFVTADAKVSAGLIEPDDRGHAFAVVNLPSDIEKVEAAAITLEPKGGSQQPTMPIYVLGKVS